MASFGVGAGDDYMSNSSKTEEKQKYQSDEYVNTWLRGTSR